MERFNVQPGLTGASTFPNKRTAERAIKTAIEKNKASIDDFLSSSKNRLVIESDVGKAVGRVIPGGSTTARPTTKVRVVLDRDPSMPTGYRIQTGYPIK